MSRLEHHESRHLPHSPEQLYGLVSDVGSYPEFLPWIAGARVNRREGNLMWADLMVGYKFIREKFTSKVKFNPDDFVIEVEYIDGPLRDLHNRWEFEPMEDGSCTIHFDVGFEFKSGLFQRLANAFFDEIVRRMVGAFEARANDLYGTDGATGPLSEPQRG